MRPLYASEIPRSLSVSENSVPIFVLVTYLPNWQNITSTLEVGPAGDLLSSCAVTPIVERPGSHSQVSIDEMDESHLRPLPRTNPQEALSAHSRSVLPSADAGPIDASPASGSDRPRSRAGPHGDMRGGTEEAGMGVALPPAPPILRDEVLKSGGVDHSGEPELGSEPEQEPALPGGAETEVAVTATGVPCGEGGKSLGSSGFSPPGVPGGDSPYADNSCCPVRIDQSVKPDSSENTVKALAGVTSATNKAHTSPVPQHTSRAQVESLSTADEDTVPVSGTEEQRLAAALAASAANAKHEAVDVHFLTNSQITQSTFYTNILVQI
eukprot:SAG11_NODE_2868_length_2885_cov_6.197057_2_plen_325_part_00